MLEHYAGHMGLCRRTPGCSKPAGHMGWCAGHRGFYNRRGQGNGGAAKRSPNSSRSGRRAPYMTAKSMAAYKDTPPAPLPALPQEEDCTSLLLQQHEALMASQQIALVQAQQAMVQGHPHTLLTSLPIATMTQPTLGQQQGMLPLQQQVAMLQQIQAMSRPAPQTMTISSALLQQLLAGGQVGGQAGAQLQQLQVPPP